MNKQMNMPALMNIMREFERQNEKMEMTSDMMGDAIDDAFEVTRSAALSTDVPFSVSPVRLQWLPVLCSLLRLHALHSRQTCLASGKPQRFGF